MSIIYILFMAIFQPRQQNWIVRDPMAHKAWTTYYLALYGKGVQTSGQEMQRGREAGRTSGK